MADVNFSCAPLNGARNNPLSLAEIKEILYDHIKSLNSALLEINQQIHSNPELGYAEFKAHSNTVTLLQNYQIPTTPHAYGIPTSFEAEFGTGGKVLTYCAEYDALPGIGHACGHNLIATASIASFLAVAHALKVSKITGRVRLLGTPAEEGGGGKIQLIEAGAFKDVDAALMIHPSNPRSDGRSGVSYGTCLASQNFCTILKGKAAHAASQPWNGINALNAATLAYTAVGMLRQHIKPYEIVTSLIKTDEGAVINVIVDKATLLVGTRSKTIKEAGVLREGVIKCCEGAAISTGCEVEFEETDPPYAELRPNETLCLEFTRAMAELGGDFACNLEEREEGSWGTDMGNVSHVCPSFHGCFALPVRPGETIHGAGFTRATGTQEAHDLAIGGTKGMAVVGWRFLLDEKVAKQVKDDFELDKLKR